MARNYLVLLAVFVTAAVVVLYIVSANPGLGIDARDAAQVARGRVIYEQRCAVCHGQRLEGQPNWRARLPNGRLPAPPHDDTGHTWHHSDEVLFAIVKNGLVPPYAPAGYESDMPAFSSILSGEDMRAVLAYIESHWSDRVGKIREEMLAPLRGTRR